MRSAVATLTRVSRGRMTSSMYPSAAAAYGLANLSRRACRPPAVRALTLVGCVAGGLAGRLGAVVLASMLLVACFERLTDSPCPVNKPFPAQGVCFEMPPDGFVVPDGFMLPDGFDLGSFCVMSSDCAEGMPICASQMCRKCVAGAPDDVECSRRSMATPKCDGPSGK